MLHESTTFSKRSAIIVAAISVLVMLGWMLNISFLKSIIPGTASMLFISAFGFFLSSIVIMLVSIHHRNNLEEILLAGTTLFLIMITLSLLASMFTGISLGIETLFAEEKAYLTATARPSIGTLLGFLLVALMGFIRMYFHSGIACEVIGISLCIIGGVALFGMAVGIPLLYYTAAGGRMSLLTAVLFIILGIGLLKCTCCTKVHKE